MSKISGVISRIPCKVSPSEEFLGGDGKCPANSKANGVIWDHDQTRQTHSGSTCFGGALFSCGRLISLLGRKTRRWPPECLG